jgi:putative ABC transport system permease protein
MLEVAIVSLVHDTGKLIASLAGVALSATLLLVQLGLFAGFLDTSSALIRHVGGDVWVMARGTEVLDNGEALSIAARNVTQAHPCVEDVRAVVTAIVPLRKPSGALDHVQVVGVEEPQRPLVPWSLTRGLLSDLALPLRVTVDEHDLDKLQIRGEPIGATLSVAGNIAHVAGVTTKIRSFALAPYLFTSVDNARTLTHVGDGQAHYFVADLREPSCAAAVTQHIDAHPDLEALTMRAFAERTETYWVFGSGAGAALGFSALFGLIVGAVIVGQTLFSITKEHLRELATLKAMGASRRELIAFVGWQAAFIGVIGGLIGGGVAFALESILSANGIQVILSPLVLMVGAVAVLSMCVLASVPSARRVLAVEAAEVFR